MTDQIKQVLADHARLAIPAQALTDHTDLYAAGLTSHASVNVMFALEALFDIQFPDSMMRKATFGSITAIRAAVELLTAGAKEE